jgi:hypothetical protein
MFTNSSDETIETDILLRGKLNLEVWDPHTGMINKGVKSSVENNKNVDYTKVELKLEPVSSVFLLSD